MMALGNYMCVFIIFVISVYTKSICDSLEIADPEDNSITDSDAVTDTQDNVSNLTVYRLKSLDNEDSTNNINTNNDGLTADQQKVMDIVQKQLNSILRGKRQKCDIPQNMVQDFTRLYQQLNSSIFYGTTQDESPRVRIPHIQLETCPNNRFELPVESEVNSLSVCPWRVIEKDLGNNAFPRYMHDVHCVCLRCTEVKSLSCTETRHPHEFLEFTGCENGLAVFTRKYEIAGYNCYCRNASFQTLIPNKNEE